jgi:hypothetical protein
MIAASATNVFPFSVVTFTPLYRLTIFVTLEIGIANASKFS